MAWLFGRLRSDIMPKVHVQALGALFVDAVDNDTLQWVWV